jgi:transcriptional regulator with XRE-family HTH domain
MPKSLQATLGATVRELRVELRISQESLAERCELHRTYIGGIERGERNVSLENIVRLARALQVSPSKLLERIK